MTTPGASDPSQRTPQERASDPATSALELQQLAADHPEVRPAIAKHPAAYPALLDWLGALGDSAVNAALVERRSASVAPPAPVVSSPEPQVSAPSAASAPEAVEPVAEPVSASEAVSPAPVVEESVESSDDVAESASPAPVTAEEASSASPVPTASPLAVASPVASAPEATSPVEVVAEPEATQISPVQAEPAPVAESVESPAAQRTSVFATVQNAQEQASGGADSAVESSSPSSASPDVSDVVAGALGADVTESAEPQAPEASAPAPTESEPQAPSNPFSREFSAGSPQQQGAPAAGSVPDPSPYAPAGYGVPAGSGVSAPTAPIGAPGYGAPVDQYGQQGQYGTAGQQGGYGQPGYTPEPAPAPAPKVHDGRAAATLLLISLVLGTSVIALWDAEVLDLDSKVYSIAAAVLLLVAVAANIGVLFRALRRGFAGLSMWASFTLASLIPVVFYNATIAGVDLADATVDGGSPLDLLMRAQNSTYSAIDSEWGRLIFMAIPLVLALTTFVVALTKRKAALAQLSDASDNATGPGQL